MNQPKHNYNNIDWSRLRDVDVAKKYGISRERARQVRNKIGAPCTVARKTSKRLGLESYLVKNRPKNITAAQLWKKLPMKVGRESAYRAFHDLGLDIDFSVKHERKPAIKLADWRLPNSVIDMIWDYRGEGVKTNFAANTRSRLELIEAAWRIGGAGGFSSADDLIDLDYTMREQALMSQGQGNKINKAGLQRIYEKIKNKILTSGQKQV